MKFVLTTQLSNNDILTVEAFGSEIRNTKSFSLCIESICFFGVSLMVRSEFRIDYLMSFMCIKNSVDSTDNFLSKML